MRSSNYRKKIEIDQKTKKIIAGSIVGFVLAAVIFFVVYFHVDTVEVMGSGYYTEDEIKEMVLKGPMAKNSVLAPMLYSKSNTEDIPFVEAVVVSQVNNHTICISVKELQPVGCIKYLDCYMYFDRQGVIVASSVERQMRVPYFEGIEIESVAFGDELPFAEESLLNTSVSLARIFAKNDDIPDHIMFDESNNITLTYGEVTAQLGKDKYLEDKMTRLIAILPHVLGQKGILHLENVNDTNKNITFEKEMTAEAQNEDGEDSDGDQQDGDDSDYDSSSGDYDSDSGYDSGYDSSYDSGYDSSYDSGYDSSYDSGYDSSYDSGNDSSYDSGYDSSYSDYDSSWQ